MKMRGPRFALSLVLLALVPLSPADGQVLPVIQPEQFYSNGERVGAWTPDPANHRKTTFWFARYSPNDWVYRQQLVIIYDNRLDKAYYYDPIIKEFFGRFDMIAKAYSLLPKTSRSGDLAAIDEDDFPSPGAMPTLDEMLRRPDEDGPGSATRMLPPPPTAEFPARLGITMQNVTYFENGVGQIGGVRIQTVEPGSPAAMAGLEVGDIIVRVDGIRTTSFDDVQKLIARSGGAVTLRLKNSRQPYQYVDTPKINMNIMSNNSAVIIAPPAPAAPSP